MARTQISGSLNACFLTAASVFAMVSMLVSHPQTSGAWSRRAADRLADMLNLHAHPAAGRLDIAPPMAPAVPAPYPSAPRPPVAGLAVERLRQNLSPALLARFDLFLYVSKAPSGPLAQHMAVIGKDAEGRLRLLHDWPASTGREQSEVTPLGARRFTGTPVGYYELDPNRMYVRYHSHSWDESMPYTMFFNWERKGSQTGLAIHAAVGADVYRLGHRASAGCIHLSLENARTLYSLVKSDYRGPAPRFAYDAKTQSSSNEGRLMRDTQGRVRMADGYKVLVFVEDHGGKNVVARAF